MDTILSNELVLMNDFVFYDGKCETFFSLNVCNLFCLLFKLFEYRITFSDECSNTEHTIQTSAGVEN